jgi:hypothetical protein
MAPKPYSSHPDEGAVAVARLPTCEFCLERSEFVGSTSRGHRQSYMCGRHFKQYGRGLGSHGHRLVVMPPGQRAPR